ncbi:FabD/lysophospholipase-like protein [Lindgomyces ingoldianus]|uniref:FabD/lysophospholipase-like protein n=1 Tax=Lindgomyces ingoldianus TaxID=673940 RepID=A0ACB6R4K2_9PLEO|nr:FabD/lysophospholipase-like protein [Lindgomyces ingoldianus]KAF2474189.1 FabD/lysophospholipase-like protein [Lindgomyces ingoldianus]
MSLIEVDFGLVRYSPIEGTHYFYDSAFPTTIQFLLNGAWESWDVGWVRQQAQDPEVRRIAKDAEARLVHENASGYRAWPPLSPGHSSPILNGHVPSRPTRDAIHPPSRNGEIDASVSREFSNSHSQSPSPASSQTYGPVTSTQIHTPPLASPYSSRPTLSAFHPIDPRVVPALPPEGALPPIGHEFQQPYPALVTESSHTPISPISVPHVMIRETKILLSLDGDGVRGLSAVLLVESLVNAICTKIGRRVDPYQIFDLIGGTSTGGLLAIMLGRLRMRPHRARDAYVNLLQSMYADKFKFFMSLDPHASSTPSDGLALENKAKDLVRSEVGDQDEIFFDQRRDSTNVFVISTQVEIGVNRPALIRSYLTRRMAGPELAPNLTIWEALRATSAAPRYIDLQGGSDRRAVIEPGLIDYGTAKNNPIRDLFYETRKLYSYANDTMIVVSVGTGTGLDRMQESNEMANSVDDRSAEAKTAGDKFEVDMQDLIGRGWLKYFRFNVPDLDDVPLEEWNQVDILKAKTSAYLGKTDVRQRFYGCVDAVAELLMAEQAAWERAQEKEEKAMPHFEFPPRAVGR